MIHSGAYYMGIKLQTIRECFGGVCAWPDCHETENLEFAHRHGYPTISGRGRGQWNRIKDIMKHPMNYILYCIIHHKIYDKQEQLQEVTS